MPKQIRIDGTVHSFPDDFTDADIAAALSGPAPLAPSHGPQTETPAAPVNVGGRGTGLDVRRSQRVMTDALPTIGSGLGAAVGGLTSPVTGPVGPVVGAGLGGALGTSLQSAARGEAQDPNALLESGLMNASLQAVSPIGGAAAKGLYKGGVALLPRTLKQEFPNLAESGFREGIALTKRGAEQAGQRAGASAREADAIIGQASGTVSPMRVVREFRPVMQRSQQARQLGRPDDVPEVMDRARTFIRRNQGGITPTNAQGLKKEAQARATTAYKARDRGASINETTALLDKAQARGLRQELERIAPDVGPVNKRTQELMGLERAADQASNTGHILSRVGGAGTAALLAGSGGGMLPAVAAAGAGGLLTTPGGLTGTAMALKPIAAHLPMATRAAILAALLGDGEGQ